MGIGTAGSWLGFDGIWILVVDFVHVLLLCRFGFFCWYIFRKFFNGYCILHFLYLSSSLGITWYIQ